MEPSEEDNPIQSGVTVLEYHKIGSPPPGCNSPWYTHEDTFVGHLRCLREGGWRVISLAEFLGSLQTPGVLLERLALLTFDDAYRSLRGAALRRLREFGYPATVFVPTAFIGGKNEFDRGREPGEEICTWADLHELAGCRVFSVQSHGVFHREKPADSELVEEIGKSKEILQSQLGTPIEAFAYPYGNAGSDYERIREALRQAGYRAAFLADGGRLNVPVDDIYRLNRLVMLPWTDLRTELTR